MPAAEDNEDEVHGMCAVKIALRAQLQTFGKLKPWMAKWHWIGLNSEIVPSGLNKFFPDHHQGLSAELGLLLQCYCTKASYLKRLPFETSWLLRLAWHHFTAVRLASFIDIHRKAITNKSAVSIQSRRGLACACLSGFTEGRGQVRHGERSPDLWGIWGTTEKLVRQYESICCMAWNAWFATHQLRLHYEKNVL